MEKIFSHVSSLMAVLQSRQPMLSDALDVVEVPTDEDTGNSGHCPIDNINLSMKVDIFPDNYTKREIQEQRMSCPFAAKGT
ncbi:hypothetical protein RR48_00063 [Papilio machaon]|uniref:Uncharacterized protein n=1 Tax=Papilio machaon TaxID=76193 RepID=A0A0N0PFR7_PAPMA|nr:hypothetical protein RR48_00063 [Papilio machaon]